MVLASPPPEQQTGNEGDLQHPDALGVERYLASEFVEATEAGGDVVTRVLRWDPKERRGRDAHIRELPRDQPRPAVYCPFCGRQGVYEHTGNSRKFFHSSGDQSCVATELESALHRRAKTALVEGLKFRPERGFPPDWQRRCRTCVAPQNLPPLMPGGWECEVDEHEKVLGGAARRPWFDAAALVSNPTVAALEVRESSPVDSWKLDLMEEVALAMVGVPAKALINDRGEAAWTGDGPLPPALVRRVLGQEHTYLCERCQSRASLPKPPEPEPREDPLKGALPSLCCKVLNQGLDLIHACCRCSVAVAEPLLPPRATVELVSKRPLHFRFHAHGTVFPMVVVEASEVRLLQAGSYLVVAPALVMAQSIGPAKPSFPARRLQGVPATTVPRVCGKCRKPPRPARDLDELWRRVSKVGDIDLLQRLKLSVEQRFLLAPAALDYQLDRLRRGPGRPSRGLRRSPPLRPHRLAGPPGTARWHRAPGGDVALGAPVHLANAQGRPARAPRPLATQPAKGRGGRPEPSPGRRFYRRCPPTRRLLQPGHGLGGGQRRGRPFLGRYDADLGPRRALRRRNTHRRPHRPKADRATPGPSRRSCRPGWPRESGGLCGTAG